MKQLNSFQAEAILDAAIAHLTEEARERELDYLRHSDPKLDELKVADQRPAGVPMDRAEQAAQAFKEAKRAIVLCEHAKEMKEELHGKNLAELFGKVQDNFVLTPAKP